LVTRTRAGSPKEADFPDPAQLFGTADRDVFRMIPRRWSIHVGAGASSHTFCRAMAGDNVEITDMEMVAMEDLL
jgi:hypothetical protein